jgi:hypothetical protein
MNTSIWCDRKQHIVHESPAEVETLLATPSESGFIVVSLVGEKPPRLALRASAITSFTAEATR